MTSKPRQSCFNSGATDDANGDGEALLLAGTASDSKHVTISTQNVAPAPAVSSRQLRLRATGELANSTLSELVFSLALSSCFCPCETTAEQSEETNPERKPGAKRPGPKS